MNIKKKSFVIGDIHGSFRALEQCLKRANFDYENDHLTILGDVCDGWSQTREVVDKLMKIKNLIFIRGNHDQMFMHWIDTGNPHRFHLMNGGLATFKSYAPDESVDPIAEAEVSQEHIDFFNNSIIYHHDEEREYLFVHAGYQMGKPLEEQDDNVMIWNREFINHAAQTQIREHPHKMRRYMEKADRDGFNLIFVGHSVTTNFNREYTEPQLFMNVWDLDTAAGWGGRLTIMDVDTKEFWQSDLTSELHPDENGR